MSTYTELQQKLAKLKQILGTMGDAGGAAVAFSGGVDSTLLVRVCKEVLGDNILAITAASAAYPESETAFAQELANMLGVKHITLTTDELADEQFAANPPDRCYFCKKALFGKLQDIAAAHGLPVLLDGTNVDDSGDFRPGARAAQELGVRSPLREAGLTKNDIRSLLKEYGLPNWNKPSFACFATRFPYGERITKEKLDQVGQAETYLRQLGFTQLRVRHHNNIARIEVVPEQMPQLLEMRLSIAAKLTGLGYKYVTLDLVGYRTGSMNEVLPPQTTARPL